MNDDVLRLADIDAAALIALLGAQGLTVEWLAPDALIPGSYWGESEAGLVGDRLYWIAEDPVADNLAHLLDLAWSPWLLLPGAFLLAAVLLHVLRRRRPEWVRISLSREEVRVEGPAGRWTTPVAAFSGLALRRRDGRTYLMTQQYSSNMRQLGLQGPSRPLVRREALWWVELVHPEPERSVPIWAAASDHAGEAARRAARRFAARLDLPMLR